MTVVCDVCSSDMLDGADFGESDTGWGVWWVCGSCLASQIVSEGSPPLRPKYAPLDCRWGTAIEPQTLTTHAALFSDVTVCRSRIGSMIREDFSWDPDQPNACRWCREAAMLADQRWPSGKRGRP